MLHVDCTVDMAAEWYLEPLVKLILSGVHIPVMYTTITLKMVWQHKLVVSSNSTSAPANLIFLCLHGIILY